jgi:signal transduction histidine kinase
LDISRQAAGGSIEADWLSERLEALSRRLQKFLDMLNRIMDVSRVRSGRVSLQLETQDAAELVRDICASFERELQAARCDLHLEAPPELVGTWDRLRLTQIATNILSNAIRYGAGKPIQVALEGDAEWVRLSVRDHGIGIAPEEHERIFVRFERAQGRHTGGFGIGLWIVRETCRAMGGTVHVESSPGQGATFVVKLPRHVRDHE